MVSEIIREFVGEIAGDPLRFVAEVVQFVVLVAIVWVVAVGWGSRRGFVANMLAERGERIRASVRSIAESEAELAQAREDAAQAVKAARAEARAALTDSKRDAAALEIEGRAAADKEAELIASRAEQAIKNETAEMHADLREQLIDVVAQATRAVMSEHMTLLEQRELIEESIVASLQGSGLEAAKRPGRPAAKAGERG
jgi:F0F1-type ATP synthase membrane subunit b/b'